MSPHVDPGAIAPPAVDLRAASSVPADSAATRDTAAALALGPDDLAADHLVAYLSQQLRLILHVTPVNVDEQRDAWLAGDRSSDPAFRYRRLDMDPDVLDALLASIRLDDVKDPTLGHLLLAKHRELTLQSQMLRARGTQDFRSLSVELYGGVAPALRATAEQILVELPASGPAGTRLDASAFLALAERELDHYRSLDPDISLHAEIRSDVSGVMVESDTLLIGTRASVAAFRADALVQHEVGTHLVTHANGEGQPIRVLSSGLAGYDETQEGLAVLAEIACGRLTPGRLRQLATRVLTVHRMLAGGSFAECFEALLNDGIPERSAFTTTMRVHRSGGLAKDAVYLRGLLDLLTHLRGGGHLDVFWLGKFALQQLPLLQDLADRGILVSPRIVPRWAVPAAYRDRVLAAAASDDLTTLVTS